MKKYFEMMKEDVEGVVLVVMGFAIGIPMLWLSALLS